MADFIQRVQHGKRVLGAVSSAYYGLLRLAYHIELELQRQPPPRIPFRVTAAWDGFSLALPQRPAVVPSSAKHKDNVDGA